PVLYSGIQELQSLRHAQAWHSAPVARVFLKWAYVVDVQNGTDSTFLAAYLELEGVYLLGAHPDIHRGLR
ncbi:MAG: hypothetical protein WBR10_12360, partial [Candidatus Acidiferrum sp.]